MYPRTLIGLATAFVTLIAPPIQAACVAGTCGLMGNARFEFAHVPVPITAALAPTGGVLATSMATVMQGGVAPRSLVFGGSEFTAPAAGAVLPVFLLNSQVFQVGVSAAITHPGGPATFSKTGRFGPAIYSYSPGFRAGCADASQGTAVSGRLRYAKTASQFGGTARPTMAGNGHVALRVSSAAPCSYGGGANPNCVIHVVNNPPPPTPAIGATFGSKNTTLGVPNPGGLFQGTVTAAGLVVGIGNVLGPGSGLTRISYGGPWTTGDLTISVTVGGGGPPNSIFMLDGTDVRTPGGSGVISLVSGAVTERRLGGVPVGNEINAGWMTLMVPEPAPLLGATAAWLALFVCHALVVRRGVANRIRND